MPLVKRLKPEVIVHLGAQINLRTSIEDPFTDARTNVCGSLMVAHAAVIAGVRKVIFSSTGGPMYSEKARLPWSEKLAAEPMSPYGISKRTAEMYLAFYHAVRGLPYVALRYANVYGPRQNAKGEAGVISIFIERLLNNKPLVINGTGRQTRDFVYVDDVVHANLLAMQKNVSGIFNIGTGKETSVNVLYKKINKLARSSSVMRYGSAMVGEAMRSSLDAQKARQLLGWSPLTKIDEGLVKTVEWFRKNRQ